MRSVHRPAEAPFRCGDFTVVSYPNVRDVPDGGGAGGFRSAGAPPHCVDWTRAVMDAGSWWLVVRRSDQPEGTKAEAGFSVTVIPTRALPGHRILRLERVRFAPDPGPAEAAIQYLLDLARRDRRTVKLTIEAFFSDDAELNAARAILERAGLDAVAPRLYTHTVRINLAPDPETLLSAIHASARRNIRAVTKRPVIVHPVQDASLASRLDVILDETFSRTATRLVREPWPAIIEYCRRHPDRARLVSLVRTDRDGPDALIAFALGVNRGDHVDYAIAGSTRPADFNFPAGYALAWDLICWARSIGATWFDFGGVTANSNPADPRSGIREFKLMFGTEVVEVRREWQYVPRPARAAWVRTATWLAERVRALGRRLRKER